MALAGFIVQLLSADIIPGAFWGIFICTVLYAIGAGLIEVLITPIVDSCPTAKKAGSMAFVHSSFSAGCVKDMIKTPMFWIFGVVMVCAGASELSMSQWASAFAEAGLGVSKTMGDLLGPCAFAFLMFLGRIIYGKISDKVDIVKVMLACSALCVAAYITASFAKQPVVALLGCCVCGFAVGPMWPGTFSLCSKYMPNISSVICAAYALFGDLGCTGGPAVVGLISGDSSNISKGLSIAVVFPVLLALCLIVVKIINRNNKKENLHKSKC